MAPIEVRLRPTTPWRVGHGGGGRERVDVVYHSDALFSAVTQAMKTLGWLDEWLAVTAAAGSEPAVSFSSLFPFIGKARLIAPPKTWWPPASPGRLYTDAAKLIPLEVVRNGIVDESRWIVDGETGCLFHTGSGAPVKIVVRTAAAVDRLTGVADPHRIACLEFAPNAGWWGVFTANDALWESRVKAAFRLLADSGFGGERSRGWGRAAAPEFSDASQLLTTRPGDEGAWWLLSMYSPHESDAVDWSRGEYSAMQRGGWTDSQAGVAPKKQVRMLEEGSVLYAASLRGRAVDVAPDGFPHPVYRSGFALAVPAPPEPVMRTDVGRTPASAADAHVGLSPAEAIPAAEPIVPGLEAELPAALQESAEAQAEDPLHTEIAGESACATTPDQDGGQAFSLPEPLSATEPAATPETPTPDQDVGQAFSLPEPLSATEPAATPEPAIAGESVRATTPDQGVGQAFSVPEPLSATEPSATPEPATEGESARATTPEEQS